MSAIRTLSLLGKELERGALTSIKKIARSTPQPVVFRRTVQLQFTYRYE
jgi:hypothetical protein